MNLKTLQTELKSRGWYDHAIDGIYGKFTKAGILKAMGSVKPGNNWSSARMIIAGEQGIYLLMGIPTGSIDGLLGPQTRYARDVYKARKAEGRVPSSVETWRDGETDVETSPKTIWPRQRDVQSFFGSVGTNQTSVNIPYPMVIAWDTKSTVNRFSCHKKVEPSIKRILQAVLDHYGYEEIKRLRLDLFGGCLNVRKMRGGSSWSMHSWGIAVDIDPIRNQLKWGASKASLARPEYKAWFEAWEKEGAISLGRERNYDWMHTQFARL